MIIAVRPTLLVVLGIAVLIQLVPVTRSSPPVEGEVETPPGVHAVLKRACYDCHSHETAWPWYSGVAPVSWLVARDVRKGRRELDFSAWDRIAAGKKTKKIAKIWNEVAEGAMPPWYYLLMHREARLSAADRATIRDWTAAASR